MNTTSKHSFLSATVCTAIVLGTMLHQAANAQCYIDPFTGRQVCTQPAIGWRSPSGSRSNPQSEIRNPKFSRAHCRISVGDGSTGSGTLIARDESRGLVLTCSHLFDDSTDQIVATFPNGQRFGARLLDRDRAHDLAVVAIRPPGVEPIEPTDAAAIGTLYTCGFGSSGQFRCIRGEVTGQAVAVGATFPSLTIRGAARPGDSGGGVLNSAGQLVGVIWGQRDGQTYATCDQPVRELLDRVLGQRAQERNHVASATSPSSNPTPQIDWQAWSTEIEERIGALDSKKQDKGDYLQPGDLNGYVRAVDLPKLDETQFVRQSEVSERFESVSKHVESVKRRAESLAQRLEHTATSRIGLFEGLSLSKLLVGTLGLSGPLATALIVASGLARRRVKSRAKSQEPRAENAQALDSRASALDSRPIAVDSPPPPQRTMRETHYVPVEKDSFAKAHQWASEHVARKYPGAAEVLQAQDSLIKQYIAAH
jgi:hypothetical protein